MDKNARRQQRQENVISSLNVAIEGLDLTKEILSITPAKAVCGSVSVVLTMIRVRFLAVRVDHCRLTHIQDSMTNEADYVELGLACADICTALGRGMDGKKMGDLSQSVSDAIGQLTTCVEPAMYRWNSPLTVLLIAEPWRRSKRRSSSGAAGIQSPDFFTQNRTRKQSPPGGQTSTGSFMSSTYVQLFLLAVANSPLQTELAVNTNIKVSSLCRDVSKIVRGEVSIHDPPVSANWIRPIGNRRILMVA